MERKILSTGEIVGYLLRNASGQRSINLAAQMRVGHGWLLSRDTVTERSQKVEEETVTGDRIKPHGLLRMVVSLGESTCCTNVIIVHAAIFDIYFWGRRR